MSILTARGFTSTLSIESHLNEAESVYSQLDRLNQVIQNIAIDQLSPELSRHILSPSLESHNGTSRFSYYQDEESCDVYLNTEICLLEIDRLSMIREDFRAFNQREHEKLRVSDGIFVELTHTELRETCNNINRIQTSKSKENVLNLGNKKVRIAIIKDDQEHFENKNLIKHQFEQISNELDKTVTDWKNDEFYKYLENDIEKHMALGYLESFDNYKNSPSLPSSLSFPLQSDVHKLNSQKIETQKLIQKLEWQSTEVLMLKDQYHKKIQKLTEHEKFLSEKSLEIQSEENKIKTQKILMAKDAEILSKEKKIIEQTQEDNRKKQEIIKNTLEELSKNANVILKPTNSQTLLKKTSEERIVLKPRRNENKFDVEISVIQQEIKALENILLTDTTNSESIQTKIDRLKTKQSSLKSKRVINASLERSNSLTSKINFFEKERKKSLLTQEKPVSETSVLLTSNKINILNSKPPIKSKIEKKDSSDDFEKFLKLKENRLVEKEEELNKRESMVLSQLSKAPDNISLVSFVQNEQRNLRILRNDLEKRQKNLEQEVLGNARKFSETKAKEREVLNAIESFDVFLYQKKHLESRLQFLLTLFEDSSKE